MPRFLRPLLLVTTLVTACTVGTPTDPDAPEPMFRDAPRTDAPVPPVDVGPPPACELDATLGQPCEADGECDDHCYCNGREICAGGTCTAGAAPCTASDCASSSCDEDTNACTFAGDDSLCDDGDPCNGAERCDGTLGCRPGPAPLCNDADLCTVDACVTGMGCVFTPYDGDGDGEPATTCGGTDCNDRDPAIGPDAVEDCDNGIDDDCDGATDIASAACVLLNDDCATGEPITPTDLDTTRYRRTTSGFDSDVTLGCTPSTTDTRRTAPDAVFFFTLAAARDVRLAVEGLGYNAGVLLRRASECATGPDLQCQVTSSSTVEPVLNHRSLPPGDYAIVVKTRTAGPFTLAVTLGPPTTPQNECQSGVLDISAGGTFRGVMDDDDYVFPCHTTTSSTYDDVVHQLVVPAGEFRDVRLMATATQPSGSTTTPYVYLTSACGDSAASTSVCDAGTTSAAAELSVAGLPAGTYWVLVEGAYTTAGTGSYELIAEVLPSTGRPPGDSCASGVPVALTEGVAGTVDLSRLTDAPDAGAFCGANRPGYRDAFFVLSLTEERDVLVETSSSARHWLGVSSSCGTVPRVRDCAASSAGTISRRFLRLGPGQHFVNVSTLAAEGTLEATYTTFPPTPRPADDVCAGATALVDGTPTDVDLAIYEDDQTVACSAAQDVDAYFTFTLATPRFVTLRAEGATAMALVPGACGSTPSRCVTGGPPQITEVLPAGIYHVLVESQPLLAGPARIRFTTSDP